MMFQASFYMCIASFLGVFAWLVPAIQAHRHSGVVRRTESGISGLRVRCPEWPLGSELVRDLGEHLDQGFTVGCPEHLVEPRLVLGGDEFFRTGQHGLALVGQD